MDSDSSSEDTAVLVARNTGTACFEYHRDLAIRLDILEVQNALVLQELRICRGSFWLSQVFSVQVL